MTDYQRSDLACEAPRPQRGSSSRLQEYRRGDIRIEDLVIPAGAKETEAGRLPGRYVTLHCPKIWEMDRSSLIRTARTAADILHSFLKRLPVSIPSPNSSVLVAGLGNRFITADSIGPRTADLVTVTNHAAGDTALFEILGCSRVSALSPGVLGQTGLEAAALITEAAVSARADVIIAVDALAARSTARLGTTVQITDTGIRPGSGIGNHRAAVTEETTGIPVIAMGVPTVVDSSTLVWDVLHRAGIHEISEELEAVLQDGRSMIVSPRESDRIAESVSDLLAQTLNRALTPALL